MRGGRGGLRSNRRGGGRTNLEWERKHLAIGGPKWDRPSTDFDDASDLMEYLQSVGGNLNAGKENGPTGAFESVLDQIAAAMPGGYTGIVVGADADYTGSSLGSLPQGYSQLSVTPSRTTRVMNGGGTPVNNMRMTGLTSSNRAKAMQYGTTISSSGISTTVTDAWGNETQVTIDLGGKGVDMPADARFDRGYRDHVIDRDRGGYDRMDVTRDHDRMVA